MTFAQAQSQRALRALALFHESSLDNELSLRTRADPALHALELFRDVAASVPAYRRFLVEHGIDPAGVRTPEDFARLPATTKENYHRPSSLAELCRGGLLERSDFVAVSSGSTGEPTLWPRFVSDEIGTAWRFEQVLADAFGARQKRTLGVVCFALGSWVGGMYTISACRHVAAKGYPLTLVTPGNQRAEILRVVRALGASFEQVVLFGYPPFLKDVIDAGIADGLDWRRYRLKLVTAGEVFSEEWRSLVCDRAGADDPVRHVASLYGTADGGVLANETPLSVAVRRLFAVRPDAARELFGEERLPTLCQYDPLHRYFEQESGDLLFTGDGGAPLVRYRILDRGGIVTHARMREFVRALGVEPAAGLAANEARELPFVYVFGRIGFALSFYGANVYPENVSVGLEQAEVAPHVTGKFVLQLRTTADRDSELEVVVELAHGRAPSDDLERELARTIERELLRLNSEFSAYVPQERQTPRVRLLPLGDPDFFPAGVKHRYTR